MTDRSPRPAPRAARVQNALQGGKDNTAADREVARILASGHPVLAGLVTINRRFVLKAVRRLAAVDGITRYLDLGCGLPLTTPGTPRSPMIHDVITEAGIIPHVAYLDVDPLVASHTSAATAGVEGVTVIEADLAGVAGVLADRRVRDTLGCGEPAAVLLASVLHYWDEDTARNIVAGYAAALPAGSAVLISVAILGEAMTRQRRDLLPGLPYHNHRPDAVQSFFAAAGLRVARGRVGGVENWPLLGDSDRDEATVIGGIGIKT